MMKQKIKILYVENAIGWGGAAICLKLIAKYLNKERYQPIITTPHCDENYRTYAGVAQWMYIRDRIIDRDKLKEKFSNPIGSAMDYIVNVIPYTTRMYRLAKRERIDLIHLNNEPVCNMAGIFVAKLLGIPCVSHVRGPVAWNSGTSRWLYSNVDFIVTVAEWVKRNVMELGVPEQKIRAIPDGRVLAGFQASFDQRATRQSLGLRQGQPAVGMVGLLIPWKGHRVFMEAARIVGTRYPDCKLLIVGKAPECYKKYEQELKQQAAEYGLGNLVFTGHRDDVADVMRVLDVIVHASVEPDPYPNVVIEAMAAGRAVIASKLGGPLEMVEDRKTGVLIKPNNPQLLAERICELLENEELRTKLGSAAKKNAFQRWSIEDHVRKIEEIYEMILSRSQ